MVCAKCQRLQKGTQLATPSVRRKNEMYLGSPELSSLSAVGSGGKPQSSATLGNAGISKSKLLSKNAKNPYASYSKSCKKCQSKIDQGKSLCQSCAYKNNACAMCGKNQSNTASASALAIEGRKFSAK